jgi:hypothetical protein
MEPVKITRREKWYAKLCWPEIDTQRTEFVSAVDTAPIYYLPVFNEAPEPSDRIGIERVTIGKWILNGRRKAIVARWGYSELLDTVIIRSIEVWQYRNLV